MIHFLSICLRFLMKILKRPIFQTSLNMQISPQFIKKVNRKKRITDPLVLYVISKIFEHCIFDQIYQNKGNAWNIHQMGYRKGENSQHSLIVIFEKWKKNIHQEGKCGTLFVYLSKEFDCLQHDILWAKLNAYGFD